MTKTPECPPRKPPTLPDELPAPPERCPEAPADADQPFRQEPITRRPRADQIAGAHTAAAELLASSLADDPAVVEAAKRLAAATRWRDERVRAEAWLEYVRSADAFVWERALDALAKARTRIEAHLTLDPGIGEELPETRRMFAQQSEATRRGIARRRGRLGGG